MYVYAPEEGVEARELTQRPDGLRKEWDTEIKRTNPNPSSRRDAAA